MDALVQDGFSKNVAQWVVTNLRKTGVNGSTSSSFSWMFDLNGISEMYQSYEETNMWYIVHQLHQMWMRKLFGLSKSLSCRKETYHQGIIISTKKRFWILSYFHSCCRWKLKT